MNAGNTDKNWQNCIAEATDFRHELHRHPELSWQEEATAQKIRNRLTDAGIYWRVCAETGTVATLAASAPGRHVALRADIDALPMQEASGVKWASEINGCMHACGHDGHSATLFAAALWLKQHEDKLPGPVTLLFQPAEEGGHGARRMIEDGALEGIEAIFGWHNWPAIPFGKAVCPDGPVMAANGTFGIMVKGEGGHASQPEICRDPVLAAAAITQALQQIVSRHLPPQQAAVLSVTTVNAPADTPGSDTVIPDNAYLGGSFRIADDGLRDRLTSLITQIANDTARAHNVTAEVEIRPRYGTTSNHTAEAESFRQALAKEFGKSWQSIDTPVPIMASEDFSYYLNEIPGAYALIGADDGQGNNLPCHSTRYDFNDALIPVVTRLYARLAGAPLPD